MRVVDVHLRVLTVSRKTERLVNLVIALLATKRNLTKSEIFRTIEGYEGSNESMERMFERDKDELRSLGVNIEVSGLDPLFEDEQGYRINPENFAMDTNGYSPAQIAYMSLAAQLWKNASLDETSQRALRKLSGFRSAIDIAEMPAIAPLTLSAPTFLSEIIHAISEKRSIQFSYVDADLKVNARRVNAYSYFSNKGFWYFTGEDTVKNEIRTYRCDRILGDLKLDKQTGMYEIPKDFHSSAIFNENRAPFRATLRLRIGRGSQLRNMATSIKSGNDYDSVEIEYPSEKEIISLILWHLDDVEVIEPESLRLNVMKALRSLAELHG